MATTRASAMTLIVVAGLVASARSWGAGLGTVNANAAPTNPASAMWTLDQIYNVLDTRTTNVAKRAGAFTEPNAGPTNGTMHTLNDIMGLATNRAPVARIGNANIIWAVGDDWNNRAGVVWPTQRFSRVATSGSGTNQIRDNLTGLIWARNANLAANSAWSTTGAMTWTNAFDFIANSTGIVNGANSVDGLGGYGGANDWRMPNERELRSLVDDSWAGPTLCNAAGNAQWSEGDLFTGVQATTWYWSSTTRIGNPVSVWGVNFSTGDSTYGISKTGTYYVWPVRGGQ